MIEERKAKQAKEDEAWRIESLRLEEERQAVCYVCDSGDHSEEDPIVFCERCCVAVHTSCYKAVGVSGPGRVVGFCSPPIRSRLGHATRTRSKTKRLLRRFPWGSEHDATTLC